MTALNAAPQSAASPREQRVRSEQLGDGRHKLPIKSDLQRPLDKKPGDWVAAVLSERLERGVN